LDLVHLANASEAHLSGRFAFLAFNEKDLHAELLDDRVFGKSESPPEKKWLAIISPHIKGIWGLLKNL